MTKSSPPTVAIGETFHALVSGTTLHLGGTESVVLHRGDVVTVTDEILAASVDRNGHSSLPAVLLDPQRFAPGPVPDGFHRWQSGTPEADDVREEARKAAWALSTADAQRLARLEVERVYGPAPTTSRTLNAAGGAR